MERVETAYMHTESMSVYAQRQIYRNVTGRVYVYAYKNKRDCVYPQKKTKQKNRHTFKLSGIYKQSTQS